MIDLYKLAADGFGDDTLWRLRAFAMMNPPPEREPEPPTLDELLAPYLRAYRWPVSDRVSIFAGFDLAEGGYVSIASSLDYTVLMIELPLQDDSGEDEPEIAEGIDGTGYIKDFEEGIDARFEARNPHAHVYDRPIRMSVGVVDDGIGSCQSLHFQPPT